MHFELVHKAASLSRKVFQVAAILDFDSWCTTTSSTLREHPWSISDEPQGINVTAAPAHHCSNLFSRWKIVSYKTVTRASMPISPNISIPCTNGNNVVVTSYFNSSYVSTITRPIKISLITSTRSPHLIYTHSSTCSYRFCTIGCLVAFATCLLVTPSKILCALRYFASWWIASSSIKWTLFVQATDGWLTGALLSFVTESRRFISRQNFFFRWQAYSIFLGTFCRGWWTLIRI